MRVEKWGGGGGGGVSGKETLTEPVVVKNEDLAVEEVRQALNSL